MSELIIQLDQLQAPPAACREDPPVQSSDDECHLTIPLRDSESGPAQSRAVRFDRVGDQFVLSQENGPELRHWYENHSNVPEFFRTVRIMGHLIRGYPSDLTEASSQVFLAISNYISTGEIRMSGSLRSQSADRLDLTGGFLDIFSDTHESTLRPVLGQMQYLRTTSWLHQEADVMERIEWINSILSLVPRYRSFRLNFIDESVLENWYRLPPETLRRVSQVTRFIGYIVAGNASGRPWRYSPILFEAMQAYQQMYGPAIESGERGLFCSVLSQSLDSLTGRTGAGSQLLSDCEYVSEYVGAEGEQSAQFSFNQAVVGQEGQARLRLAIERESAVANLAPQWFFPELGMARQSFQNVGQAFKGAFQVRAPNESNPDFRISFNFPRFREALELMISSHTTRRREYLLLGVGYLRSFFGSEGEVPSFRLFSEGQIHRARVQVSRAELQDIRRFLRSLESRLGSSQRATDENLLWVEIATGLLGGAALVLAETLPEIRDDRGLHLGIGTTGAALMGGGSSALVAHLLGEPLNVENQYLVDGVTAAIGLVVSGALYFTLQFLLGGGTSSLVDDRFPVDGYGP